MKPEGSVATVRLDVNGRAHEIAAAGNTPLLYVLRNHLGLKAVHFGCGKGECGACRVLIDGRPLSSRDTPLWAAAGKRIVTPEGLGDAGRPHPVQSALIAEQAGQCGYCLPGIVVSAAALLERQPDPSADEVRAALDQNLCRCGSHNRIVRAVLRAAKAGAAP